MLSSCEKNTLVIARTAKQDDATQTQPCDVSLGCFVATLLAMTELVGIFRFFRANKCDNTKKTSSLARTLHLKSNLIEVFQESIAGSPQKCGLTDNTARKRTNWMDTVVHKISVCPRSTVCSSAMSGDMAEHEERDIVVGPALGGDAGKFC